MSKSRQARENCAILREFLYIHYPKTFFRRGADRIPLKVGIDLDIKAAVPNIPPFILHRVLAAYTSKPSYVASVIAGVCRVDLKGNKVADDLSVTRGGQ
jgi:sRNA-binding protein